MDTELLNQEYNKVELHDITTTPIHYLTPTPNNLNSWGEGLLL